LVQIVLHTFAMQDVPFLQLSKPVVSPGAPTVHVPPTLTVPSARQALCPTVLVVQTQAQRWPVVHPVCATGSQTEPLPPVPAAPPAPAVPPAPAPPVAPPRPALPVVPPVPAAPAAPVV